MTGIESRALPQGLRLAAYDVSIIKGTPCHRSIAILGAKWPLDKAAAQWLAVREQQVSANSLSARTYKSERYLLRSLLRGFGGKRLNDITIHDIEAYRLLRARTVSPRTVNVEMKILRMILRRAKTWNRLADDYKPLPENKRGPGRALSPEQEMHLFEVASSNPDWEVAYNAAVLAAHTTARSEELRGLRLADVDPIERTISIRRSSTKTDAGCRIVPWIRQLPGPSFG